MLLLLPLLLLLLLLALVVMLPPLVLPGLVLVVVVVVLLTDRELTYPRAIVVELQHAALQLTAVVRAVRLEDAATVAVAVAQWVEDFLTLLLLQALRRHLRG